MLRFIIPAKEIDFAWFKNSAPLIMTKAGTAQRPEALKKLSTFQVADAIGNRYISLAEVCNKTIKNVAKTRTKSKDS